MNQPWTDADLATIRTMWEQGHTAREIGKTLDRTRNSILGKVHRMGLEKRVDAGPRKAEPMRVGRVRSFPKQKSFSFKKGERRPPMLLRIVNVPDAVPVTLMERTGCCYPVTTEKPHLFCNEPTSRGDYCETHFRLMYPNGKREAA